SATLDYSAYSTGSVIVDLQTGFFGTGVGGSVSGIARVFGPGAGAFGNYNLLIGNGGDTLVGGLGRRNILVAGPGASKLEGGDDQDLLIGGSTMQAILNFSSTQATGQDKTADQRVVSLVESFPRPDLIQGGKFVFRPFTQTGLRAIKNLQIKIGR